MSEKKNEKYPRAIVGIFIFDDKDRLFLMRAPHFHNKYTCPGGSVELNETIEQTAVREAKEETNMDILDLEFLGVSNGLNLDNKIYKKPENHLIFIDYKAKARDYKNIKLNEEGIKYKWLPVSEWLKHKDVSFTTRNTIEKYLVDNNNFEHKYKRALADYQNLLKRTNVEKQEFAKYANEGIIRDILPVYDNLRVSLNHVDETAKNNGFAEGIKYVVKQFKDVLEANEVTEIDAKGKKFDPNLMEALEGKGKKVDKVIRHGYMMKGKVLVAAKVILK